MTLASRLGPGLLTLAVACGPRAVSDEPDPTIVVPSPATSNQPVASTPQLPQLTPLPKQRRMRRRHSPRAPRLPAPTGLAVARGEGPPLVAFGPIDWDGPLEVPRLDSDVLASQVERVDVQEATLADLARTRFELVRSLEAIVLILPVLDRHTRLRAGLQVCYLRRELEALERMQRDLQGDVIAFRELISPAMRVARTP